MEGGFLDWQGVHSLLHLGTHLDPPTQATVIHVVLWCLPRLWKEGLFAGSLPVATPLPPPHELYPECFLWVAVGLGSAGLEAS